MLWLAKYFIKITLITQQFRKQIEKGRPRKLEAETPLAH